jgi:hypothetical protein
MLMGIITLRLMKVKLAEHPWQLEASTTQLFPRREGFDGKPIFSNMVNSVVIFEVENR